MPIPPFDSRGFLPDGMHTATIDEIKKHFAFSVYRESLFNDFLEFLRQALDPVNSKKYLGVTQSTPIIMSGSFISDKKFPNDIDCVFLLDNLSSEQKWFWASRLRSYQQKIHSQYRVDFNIELPSGNDFGKFFSYVGPKEAESKELNPRDLRGIIKLMR